jgi:hypothetical protein
MRHSPLAALAALALASCGSAGKSNSAGPANEESAAAASSEAVDPCGLVTAKEIEAVVGDNIVETTPEEGSCTYATEAGQAASVTIESDLADGKGAMEIARKVAGTLGELGAAAANEGGGAGQDVNAMLSETGGAPNLGDEAFFGANSQLSVRKGNSYIAVQPPIMRSPMGQGNPMLGSADRKKIALAIAEKALARLP